MSDDGRVDLADFLLARIAEDEKTAGDAVFIRDRVYVGDLAGTIHRYHWSWQTQAHPDGLWSQQTLVGALSPDRVLAECEAKRRQVNELLSWTDARTTTAQTWALQEGDRAEQLAIATLRLLALSYADHPDYDEAWRP